MLTYIQTKVNMTSQTSHVHFKMSSSWQRTQQNVMKKPTSCIASEQVGIW